MYGPVPSLDNAMDLWMGGRSQNLSFSQSGVWIFYLGEVLVYDQLKRLHIGPRGWQTRTWHWQMWDAVTDSACCHVWVVALKGHPLILPDGHECVATGDPHIFFILFSFFLPLPGSSAELGVLKLARVVTVKQAIVEREHHGVQMIALHE